MSRGAEAPRKLTLPGDLPRTSAALPDSCWARAHQGILGPQATRARWGGGGSGCHKDPHEPPTLEQDDRKTLEKRE